MSEHPYCPDDTFTGSPGAGRHDYDPRDYVTHQVLAQNLVELRKISSALASLAGAPTTTNAILQRLAQLESNIMSAVSEFAAKQTAFNERLDVSVTALSADVTNLNEQIEKLQNTAGAITPEDQALLDGIEKRSDAIAAKLEALDQLTPPVPPVS